MDRSSTISLVDRSEAAAASIQLDQGDNVASWKPCSSAGVSRSCPVLDLVAASGAGICAVQRKKRNTARQRRPAVKCLSLVPYSSSDSSSQVRLPKLSPALAHVSAPPL
ncbi:hypothetical protein SAY87_002894 [Trapa incisa]|uniref:Uncharacterized protein n=1 Tax=Trapa incisa TaxID=236973 RepID=A0AAN7KN74_9MYRT|nr:hypothetical protein SAY87_002894 [Trapa incisa]